MIPGDVPGFDLLKDGMNALAEVLNLRGVSEKVLQVKLFLRIYAPHQFTHMLNTIFRT